MKGLWIIVIMTITLVLLLMLSRYQDNSIEMAEYEASLPVVEDEDGAIYESASKFRMHMKFLDEYDYALAVAIESQNWEDISKYAMLLKNTSPLACKD